MESKVVWRQGMAFDAYAGEHTFVVDAKPEVGGQNLGPPPKVLTLTSLAGCTAMDVISILTKMRQNVTGFEVATQGTLAEEHPKKFTAIKIVYQLAGEDLDPAKVLKAVRLSEERYCGVSETLRPGVALSSEVYLNGELLVPEEG